MRRLRRIGVLLMAVFATGCIQTHYRAFAYNGTTAKVSETQVTFVDGECLRFGTMDPMVDKGIWPVTGPIGTEATVEWVDANETKKSAKANVEIGWRDDSVVVVIMSNDTVTVQTGRGLYGFQETK